MNTKICSKCGIEKDLSEFYKDTTTKDKLRYNCKKCFLLSCKEKSLSGRTKILRKKNTRKKTLKGQCSICAKERLATSKFCIYHFVYSIVSKWKLSKEKIEPTIYGLIKKLEGSEYCCHYSGLKITPGFSASIDHRIPQAKGGTHDLTNLVWCHTQVNKMKQDLSEKEFISRSANILIELNYLDSKGEL